MPKPHPIELRERVISALDNGMPPTQIIKIFRISSHTLYDWKRLRDKNGTLQPKKSNAGRPSTVTPQQRQNLFDLLDAEPGLTLEQLKEKSNFPLSLPRIHGILRQAGYSLKKKTFKPAESQRQDVQRRRAELEENLKEFPVKNLIFLDESSAKTNMTRLYGRAKDGKRVLDYAPHGH